MPSPIPDRLSRRLTLTDAVFIGLSAMIGAGIFAAPGPAADAAGGGGLLLALGLAALVAALNAASVARLASLHPESGGTYAYGRYRLGPYWGYLAGWGFITGKTASCAAMALTFAHYAVPSYPRTAALAAVLLTTFLNIKGVQKTAFATRLLVIFVITSLLVFIGAAVTGHKGPWHFDFGVTSTGGVLEAAGFLFFAFAGYARIATLGEEVLNPERTLPRAIPLALALTLALYLLVTLSALATVGSDVLAHSPAPLAAVLEATGRQSLVGLIRMAAAAASIGVLLSLLAGISRTLFAMAAQRDLPAIFGAIHPVHRVPHKAQWILGGVVATVIGFGDLRSSIGFSSFLILSYYALAHASALQVPSEIRRLPRVVPWTGLISCLLLAVNLPWTSTAGGLGLLFVGTLLYVFTRPSHPTSGDASTL